MNKSLKNNQQHNLLYLLEFGPVSEQVLHMQVVIEALEKILYNCAQISGFEIDSCDVLPDYVAMTFYLNASADVDAVIATIKTFSSDALVKEFADLKKFVVDGSLWEDGYDIEILE